MNYAVQPIDNNGKQHSQIEEYGISCTKKIIANVGTTNVYLYMYAI